MKVVIHSVKRMFGPDVAEVAQRLNDRGRLPAEVDGELMAAVDHYCEISRLNFSFCRPSAFTKKVQEDAQAVQQKCLAEMRRLLGQLEDAGRLEIRSTPCGENWSSEIWFDNQKIGNV
jgi:hypothetical protein